MSKPTVLLDVKQARRDLRRFSAALDKAEPRALKLAGGNVRRAYIAGIRRGRSQAMPAKVAPLDKAWRKVLRPGLPQGGGLTQPHLWTIRDSGAHGVTVDILIPYRKTLENYQHDDFRWRVLRETVWWMRKRADDAKRLGYWPWRDLSSQWRRSMRPLIIRINNYLGGLPTAADRIKFNAHFRPTPRREVVSHVRTWAAANLRTWYLAVLAKIGTGRIKPRVPRKSAA